MRLLYSVFNSDQVNRLNMRVAAEALANSIEENLLAALANGLPPGVPTHLSHDLHRLIGWSWPAGILIKGNVAYQVGFTRVPEGDEEAQALSTIQRHFLSTHIGKDASPYDAMLRAKVAPHGDTAGLHYCAAAVLIADGLASAAYPELFSHESDLVDKDGLTDYRAVLRSFNEINPGIFQDKSRGLLLFAHAFFRRNLSRMNNLNDSFLGSFSRFAADYPGCSLRLRLDPDMVGEPESFRFPMEFEYGHGPKFKADVGGIPNGVTVHTAREFERFYHGVSATHFWWKSPETRTDASGAAMYRTFEAEELLEDPSAGLDGNDYGCRYIHSEFGLDQQAITHFDGAIRSYNSDAYINGRLQARIDRAGKHAKYTKIFRIDGTIPVEEWKHLTASFFRGNHLVPEYLTGAIPEDPIEPLAEEVSTTSKTDRPGTNPFLNVLVGYRPADSFLRFGRVLPEKTIKVANSEFDFVEFREGSLGRWFLSRADSTRLIAVEYEDEILNLPPFVLASIDQSDFSVIANEIVAAIRKDTAAKLVSKVSIALSWLYESFLVTLSTSGDSVVVAELLAEICTVVNVSCAPSAWIEPLKGLVGRVSNRNSILDDDSAEVEPPGVLEMRHVDDKGEALRPTRMWMVQPAPP